jgi:hypothetical protein
MSKRNVNWHILVLGYLLLFAIIIAAGWGG